MLPVVENATTIILFIFKNPFQCYALAKWLCARNAGLPLDPIPYKATFKGKNVLLPQGQMGHRLAPGLGPKVEVCDLSRPLQLRQSLLVYSLVARMSSLGRLVRVAGLARAFSKAGASAAQQQAAATPFAATGGSVVPSGTPFMRGITTSRLLSQEAAKPAAPQGKPFNVSVLVSEGGVELRGTWGFLSRDQGLAGLGSHQSRCAT